MAKFNNPWSFNQWNFVHLTYLVSCGSINKMGCLDIGSSTQYLRAEVYRENSFIPEIKKIK